MGFGFRPASSEVCIYGNILYISTKKIKIFHREIFALDERFKEMYYVNAEPGEAGKSGQSGGFVSG